MDPVGEMSGERLIDRILWERAKEGLLEARPPFDVDHIVAVYPPEDTGKPLEVWYVTTDGHGDFVWMEEFTDGAKLKLRPVRDP